MCSFMDVGCGTGFVLSRIEAAFPRASLHGSEMLSTGLKHAVSRLPGVEFMQMDARHIPFIDEFEAIGSFDVIEHIENDNVALKNCFQALKKEGYLFLTVPQHMWLWSKVDEDACHVRRYSLSELRYKLEQSGFEILMSSSFVSFLVPLMFFSRKNIFQRNSISKNEFNIYPWLNSLFELIMTIEIFLIKAGLRLPIGGSIILVAKKS
mgnify:CR=1 FL=1